MEIIFIIFMFILGSCLGSFYACIGYRIPNKISIVKPSSFCDNCKKALNWYMNIPILSYIFLKGKCAYCKEKISPISFLIEISTALLFACAYSIYGITPELFIFLIISSALMITLVSDFEYFYISDRVIVISVICLILAQYFNNGTEGVLLNIISGISLFLLIYFIKFVGDKILKRECLGGGDIKLMGVVGLSVGFVNGMYVLILASLVALIFSLFIIKKSKNDIVPFGPFILLATLIVFYYIDFFTLLIK